MRTVFLLCWCSLGWGAGINTAWAAGETVPAVAKQLTSKVATANAEGGSDLIGQLVALYPDASAPDQVIAIRSIGKAANAKDVELRHAAFYALGKLRVKGSAKYLNRWLSPPKKGEVAESCFKAIETAGEIADPRAQTKLFKLSDHKNVEVAVAAIRALAGYRTLPVPARKKLAMNLVRKLGQLSSGGSRGMGRAAARSTQTQPEDTGPPRGQPSSGADAAARAAALRGAISQTLNSVTGAHCVSPADWVRWRKRAKKLKDPFE